MAGRTACEADRDGNFHSRGPVHDSTSSKWLSAVERPISRPRQGCDLARVRRTGVRMQVSEIIAPGPCGQGRSVATYRIGDYLHPSSYAMGLTEFATGATLSPYTATWLPAPTRKFFTLVAVKCASFHNLQIFALPFHPLHRCNHQINSRFLPTRQGLWRQSERFSGYHAQP